MELFPDWEENASSSKGRQVPLAEKIRPKTWECFIGQQGVIGEGRPLRELVDQESNLSFILWGPPGAGKTTIARIIGYRTGRPLPRNQCCRCGSRGHPESDRLC